MSCVPFRLLLIGCLGACGESDLAAGGGGANEGAGGSSLPSSLSIELGAGRTEFVELPSEGATLELVSGPQGGWHLEITLRMTSYDGELVTLDYRASDVGGTALGYPAEYPVDADNLVLAADGRYERVGDRVVLNIAGPDEVKDSDVLVECRVWRGGTQLAETSRVVRVLDEVDELQ
ncbi:MAG: hypothetical protein JNL21_26730 [Myxococcales bacterium]|nr:hypothetical protein [Myxococcales bacterium]